MHGYFSQVGNPNRARSVFTECVVALYAGFDALADKSACRQPVGDHDASTIAGA